MITTKTLIIPTENLDPDVLASCFSIARAINSKGKSKSEIFFEKERIAPQLLNIFNTKDLKFTKSLEPNGFVVRLKSIDAKVKDVKWEEKDGEINLYISADNGKLDRKAIVKSGGTNYEKIITIGIQKLEELGELYSEHKELFESVEIINIDLSSNNSHFGKTAFVKPDASSFSEISYEFLSDEGIAIGASIATDLLSGIFWKTQSFKSGTKVSTFQTASELLSANADPALAARQAYQTLNLNQIRYLSTILKNAEVSNDGIVWSLVRRSDTNSMKVEEITFPEINLLSYYTGTKASFVLTEIKDSLVHCDLRSNQKGIKASKLAQVFGWRGNAEHSDFYIHNTIENAKIQILNELRGESEELPKIKSSKLAVARNIDSADEDERMNDYKDIEELDDVDKVSPDQEELSFNDEYEEDEAYEAREHQSEELLNPFKTKVDDKDDDEEELDEEEVEAPKEPKSYDPLPPAQDGPPPEA